jgi:hypothetical protein
MADGISRLAFLEVGRRLHERGVLPDPLHALEGDPRELCKLLLMPETVDVPALAAGMAVSRPFPSWDRSISTEIYLCRACSCHEILRVETARQERRRARARSVHHTAPPTLVGPDDPAMTTTGAGVAPGDDPAQPFTELCARLAPEVARGLEELHRYNSVRSLLQQERPRPAAAAAAAGASLLPLPVGGVVAGVGISGVRRPVASFHLGGPF